MKKVSILLLLTTVLVSFSFAQVTVVGGFELDNVTGGNEKMDGAEKVKNKMDPALWTEFYGAASQDLGPGTIGAELGLGAKLHFSSDKEVEPYSEAGDVYLKGYYSLPAGPGDLAIGISTWSMFSNLSFGLDYDGIVAGPATIGFGVGYDLNTTGAKLNTDTGEPEKTIFGDDIGFIGTPNTGDAATAKDKINARLSADFDFGLGIVYKFQYGLGKKVKAPPLSLTDYTESDNGITRIVYLDITYQVMDPLLVGIEVDDTGDEFKGFTVKPYGNYAISDNTTLGIFIKIANINQEAAPSGGLKTDDILITPGLTIKHVF